MSAQPAPEASLQEAALDRLFHVADVTHRYPGEEIAFHTGLRVNTRQSGRRVSVSLPHGFDLLSFSPQEGLQVRSCGVREEPEGLVVEWALADGLLPGDEVEFAVQARVLPYDYDRTLRSRGALLDSFGQELDSETTCVRIATRSAYMTYLPEIYHENDFLNRLLMLFESFWKPVEAQIDQSENYYDAQLTPAEFLPWMASWIGITWDDSLPEERRRTLLQSAVGLYQARGTRQALLDYLALYTHGQVEIFEHRALNFVLGKAAPLGTTIALGRQNLPYSFSVRVRVPRAEILRQLGEAQVQPEKLYRQRLEAIIDSQKPAHTTFDLDLQIIDNGNGNFVSKD
jgi:phage tail-like protein